MPQPKESDFRPGRSALLVLALTLGALVTMNNSAGPRYESDIEDAGKDNPLRISPRGCSIWVESEVLLSRVAVLDEDGEEVAWVASPDGNNCLSAVEIDPETAEGNSDSSDASYRCPIEGACEPSDTGADGDTDADGDGDGDADGDGDTDGDGGADGDTATATDTDNVVHPDAGADGGSATDGGAGTQGRFVPRSAYGRSESAVPCWISDGWISGAGVSKAPECLGHFTVVGTTSEGDEYRVEFDQRYDNNDGGHMCSTSAAGSARPGVFSLVFALY